MKILVLNSGSSSLKYQLINVENNEVLASGKYERIGEEKAFLTHKVKNKKTEIKRAAYNHEEAIDFVLKQFTNPEYKVIENLNEINATGHRVVHGGEKFKEPVLITEEIISAIKEFTSLAPLHNPAALLGIEACQKVMPGKPMVAVFDTSFHQTISEEKYLYPIPYEYYQKYGIRKYGFHGTSHKYISQRISKILGREDLKIVNCHLGQGSSLCAIKNGKSIETSMGLTPVAGIPMVTRSGDIDPSVVTFIMKKENLSAEEMDTILNKKSGLAGVSGLVPDFKETQIKSTEGNNRAKLAIEQFEYLVASYIARCAVAMNGIDVLTFTGGVGENQVTVRKEICNKLEFMGVEINEEFNKVVGEEIKISTSQSAVQVYVIPTNEELMIAKETAKLVK